jgi:hypothetical protein
MAMFLVDRTRPIGDDPRRLPERSRVHVRRIAAALFGLAVTLCSPLHATAEEHTTDADAGVVVAPLPVELTKPPVRERLAKAAVDAGVVMAEPSQAGKIEPPPAGKPGEKIEKTAEAAVQIGERRLFVIRVPRAGLSPADRARKVSRALDLVVEEGRAEEVRVAIEGTTAVLYVGAAPLAQLTPEDAAAAGDASLNVHADACAAAIRDGLRIELRRRAIATIVFSISLIVLSGLLSFLLLGGVSRAARRISALLDARENLPALRIGAVEMLTPAAVRVAVSTSISFAKPIVQFVILIGWVLFSLSLLPATEALGRQLTGFVLVPLTNMFGRVGAALPLVVLVAIGAFALGLLLRFLRVFFESVAQGGIHLGWLPPGKALPASILTRVVAVIGALLAAAPLVTGDTAEWGALRIAGAALTVTAVLAAAPALANTAAGTLLLFSGRLQTGLFVEIGAHAGRLTTLTLTELRIEDRSGAEVRVPYLVTLFRPLRLLGETLPSNYEVTVDARAQQGRIRKALSDAVRRQGRAAQVELVEIEGEVARYRVLGVAAPGEDDLASAIADALTREGLGFGRIRKLDT